MGKNNHNKGAKKQLPEQPTATSNPLLEKQKAFLASLSENDRDNFFCNDLLEPERRAQVWMDQADLGSDLVDKYSWATPDARALTILKQFSPIVEVGCGANAFWCRAMKAAGIDVVGYDSKPKEGGKIDRQNRHHDHGFPVKEGGPEVLEKESDRTLFLCYPDEEVLETEGDSEEEPESLGSACLEQFEGLFVIHVGELYGDTLSMDQAPWGRSSGPEFQTRLAAEYHCVLKAKLSNWLHVRDTISVWKRSETCEMVFAADGDEDEDEEMQYRHIPIEERLPVDVAAPCFAHLLGAGSNTNGASKSAPAPVAPKPAEPPAVEVPWDDDEDEVTPQVVTPKAATVQKEQTSASSGKKKKKQKKQQRSDSMASEKSDTSKKAKNSSCPW
jgi:hypothetical protein